MGSYLSDRTAGYQNYADAIPLVFTTLSRLRGPNKGA